MPFDTRTREEEGRLCYGDDVSNGGGGVDTWSRIEQQYVWSVYVYGENFFRGSVFGDTSWWFLVVVLGREFCYFFFFFLEREMIAGS